MDLEICDNCDAFGLQLGCEDLAEDLVDDYGAGACRRNPPVILNTGVEGEFVTLFPTVSRADWCKAWKPAKKHESIG